MKRGIVYVAEITIFTTSAEEEKRWAGRKQHVCDTICKVEANYIRCPY